MTKSIISIAAFLLLSVPTVYSKTISRNQAEDIAKNWKNSSAMTTRATATDVSPVLALELTDATTEEPALWVFNYTENNGYVVVAADDMAANTVLGYSDEGNFNQNDMPENLKYWLDEYARQIEFIRNNPELSQQITRTFSTSVQPFVQSKWNQGNPYNLLCPELNGQKSVTGCVATATSQIMYFHKAPQGPGEGSISYKWTNGGINLSEDFTKVVFDWGNMTPTYSNSSTEVQKLAVAKLMQTVGYACQMGYSPSSSGAVSRYSIKALIDNFRYSKGILVTQRDYFSLSEFEGRMVDELNAGRPIYFSGRTAGDAGHAFVCDGYNTDGYFHINWGWGGSSDGYFLTTALGPNAQGIGGSNGAYNYSQAIYSNIKPRDDDDEPYKLLLISSGDLRTSAQNVNLGKNASCSLSGYVYNYSFATFNVTMGMGIFNDQDEIISVSTTSARNMASYSGYSMGTISLQIPEDIEEGTYFIRPVYKETVKSEWNKIKISVNKPQSILMRVANGVATFATPSTSILSATNFDMAPSLPKKPYSISVDIENTGMTEYYDELMLIIRENEETGTHLAESDIVVADIEAGQTKTYTFVGNAPSRGGELVASVIDSKGYIIGSQILEFDKGEPNISAVKASVINNPDTKTVEYTCYLTNSGGDFTGNLYLRFYISQNGSTTLLNTYEKEITLIDKDGTKEFTFAFEPENPIPGASYTCILIIDNNGTLTEVTQNRTRKSFNMTTNLSVGSITTDNDNYTVSGINGGIEIVANEATEVSVYNAAGVLVAFSSVAEGASVINVPAGFYIVCTANGYSQKVIVK